MTGRSTPIDLPVILFRAKCPSSKWCPDAQGEPGTLSGILAMGQGSEEQKIGRDKRARNLLQLVTGSVVRILAS